MQKQISGAEVTRKALIEAALKLFGERGYEAVSTREIADCAAANIGSIAYHFGGKPGLRLACAEYIMERLRFIVGSEFSGAWQPISRSEAQKVLEAQLEQFGRFMATSGEAKVLATFVVREIMQPGEVFETVYAQLFKPLHMRLCQIFAAATGLEAESEEVRLAAFTMIGQVVYFRIGRPAVLKRMEWDDISGAQADEVIAVLRKNLHGLIAAYRKD